MSDDRHEVIPLVPRDDLRHQDASSPHAPPIADADRKRLQALLRELLRDDKIRKLLCVEGELVSETSEGD